MVKKAVPLMLLFALCLCLWACGDPQNEDSDQDSAVDGETIIRTDELGLLEVRVTDGEAIAYFNLDRYEEVYGISEFVNMEAFSEGPYEIKELTGKVKDVAIAQVDSIDFLKSIEATAPSIFFLMDDGSVDWVLADMFASVNAEFMELYSLGKLPWVEKIKSIYPEDTNEGIGGQSVYGKDITGKVYDLSVPAMFYDIYGGSWICELYDSGGPANEYAMLYFSQGGNVNYQVGNTESRDYIEYEGSYKVSMGEGEERPGILSLNLRKVQNYGYGDWPDTIKSTFFSHVDRFIHMELWPGEGDSIYKGRSSGKDSFVFWLGYGSLGPPFTDYASGGDEYYFEETGGTIDDYGRYLTDRVPGAREMVETHGMAILITEEYSDLAGDLCKDIWLGTNHEGKFTREILYSISEKGTIYEYDPIGDGWNIVWE